MIVVIRIKGQVGIKHDVKETLHRLRLRTKYSAALLNPTPQNQKLLRSLRNHVAYGDINSEMLKKLISKRAKPIKNTIKIDPTKVIDNLEKKSLKDQGIKPFFKLHPPIGGIESKRHFGEGKGVLGDNKTKINDLLGRMI